MTEVMRGMREKAAAVAAAPAAAPAAPAAPAATSPPAGSPGEGTAQTGTKDGGPAQFTGKGLEVRGVRIVYEPDARDVQPTTAVDDVDMTIAPGEIVALLGPSGCGKSSLLRAIAGIEPLAAGSISWDGHDVGAVPVHRRGFGLLFQDGQLFPHRSVAGNVAYGLRGSSRGSGLAGLLGRTGRRSRADLEARVRELLELVGLAGYDDRPVTTLSGGEKQRVALARSLAPEPSVLLLDEPLSALDRSLREHLAVELREVLVATRTTALFVTHDHDEAFTVADRVAVMSSGRILQIGTPTELWNAPASREVAEFLGYEAFLTADDGALLALAPHALRVVGRGGGQGNGLGNGWTGQVLSTVFRRGSADVSVQVDELGTVTVADPLPDEPLEPGHRVRLELGDEGVVRLRDERA